VIDCGVTASTVESDALRDALLPKLVSGEIRLLAALRNRRGVGLLGKVIKEERRIYVPLLKADMVWIA